MTGGSVTTPRDDAGLDHPLLGRPGELAALEEFLHRATTAGDVLVVVADAGMGKSALLDAAAGAALDRWGALVLRAAGVEFETGLGYATVNQLLLPIADALGDLPLEQARALRPLLGLGADHPPELLMLAGATLGLLRRAARDRPVLVVVDDLQWVDRASLLLLSVVARRLEGLAVGLLLAQRSAAETFFDRVAVPTLELPPLPDDDARALLLAHHPALHPSVRQRIVADAGGNPLALIELPRSLTPAQESAADALPPTLPLGARLRRLFTSRVAALPEPTRRLLLLAALHHGADTELMGIVAGSSADLGPAESAGLVRVDATRRRLAFTHPLARAAVVDLADAPDQRMAHRRLADLATDPHVRALHRAEAALGTDDAVARQLEDVAAAALGIGDPNHAVAVLLRAADLTAAAPDRARRLAAAAYLGANVTGTLTGAPALLELARTTDPDATGTLQMATAAAAHLLNSDGGVDTAHRMLTRALAGVQVDRADPAVVQAAVHTLMLVCAFGARAELWDAFAAAVAQSWPHLSPALRLASVTFADPARATPEQLAALDALVAGADDVANPVEVLEVAIAGHYVDREPSAALDRIAASGRSGGPVALAAHALVMRAMTAYHEGRWDDAATIADEAIALCVDHGYRLLEWGALNPRLLLAAARGDGEFLAATRGRMHQWALPRQMLAARTFTANVDGLAALSAGRFTDAYRTYATIAVPGDLAPHEQVLMWNVLDVVEAAVRAGRPADARRHAAAAATLAHVSPRMRFEAMAAAALVAPEDCYVAAFDTVVDDADAGRWGFQQARVELAYGERLRLDRQMRRARPHLDRAAAGFRALDAPGWLARAESARQATGGTRVAADGEPAHLTPQEQQVTELAASGLSNREIGERLHLSPRTVGAHLYRAFPKLGVTTRAALRDALAQHTGADGGR